MKTAIQDLIECIRFTDKECYATMFNEGVFDKSLEKEEEQIRKAYLLGHYDSSLDIYNPSECYNEIQKQNKS